MEEFAFDGSFKVDINTKDFDVIFDLPSSGLKIKGLSKSFLTTKISDIPNENGIYILEGDNECYIGQSKDLKKRLKTHQDNNKISFTRCFILFHMNDIRQYLDYMEAYAIQEMSKQEYELANRTNPDPEEDKLPHVKKITARKWVNEFLLFLPILGFRKTTKTNRKQNDKTEDIAHNERLIKVKLNGIEILGRDNNDVFLNVLETIGFKNIMDNARQVFDSSLDINTTNKFKYDYGGKFTRLEKKSNKNFYIHLNMSNNYKIKKLNKIKTILGLDLFIEC